MEKAWNPDSQNITVTTDSEAGSKDKVDVLFFDKVGDYSTLNSGDVSIYFNTEIQYWIGDCSAGWTSFPAALLPAETEKTWTITYNYMERLVLHCNGVLVADVVYNSTCDDSYWERLLGDETYTNKVRF